LKEYLGEAFASIELVAADLTDPASIQTAVAGCDFVVHTASPVFIEESTSEDDYIKPAVDGTLSVLRAATDSGVKRVVITSSVASAYGTKTEGLLTEDDWTDLATCTHIYRKSKTLAERAAWDF
jgi:nucleoside-diphosphate-sugar epimerase